MPKQTVPDKILEIVEEQLDRLKMRSKEVQLTADEVNILKTLGDVLNTVQGTRKTKYKDGYDRYNTLSTDKLRAYATGRR